MLMDDRSVQRAIKAAGFYPGLVDGAFGRLSRLAARTWVKARVGKYVEAWSDTRVRIAAEQLIMKDLGFYLSNVDGVAGPATQVALEKWQDFLTFKRAPLPDDKVAHLPGKNVWPRQAECLQFYGKPGENQTKLTSPYDLYLDWELSQKVTSFSCHEKIHDPALRVMERVADAYGLEKIHELGLDQFGGCLNVRKMRNGSAWSMHAWGIAIDWDADRNSLRETSKTARMAQPEYARFLDLWEEEGFVSLGRARNFDWMHVQAARL